MGSKRKSKNRSKNKKFQKNSGFVESSQTQTEVKNSIVSDKASDSDGGVSLVAGSSFSEENDSSRLYGSSSFDQADCSEDCVVFFNDANEYIEHFETVLSYGQEDTRLNVVIRSQDSISTKKVPSNIYLYTGEVWWSIHKARQEAGYYKKVLQITK